MSFRRRKKAVGGGWHGVPRWAVLGSRRWFRVPVEQIGYVRAVLEGYDGLATVECPDTNRGEIAWVIGAGLDDEAQEVYLRLVSEVRLVEIPAPPDW